MLLEPKDFGRAREWSLSGVYGLGAFPWHSDGAVSSSPPRWLLLQAIELSYPTCTELLVPDADLIAALRETTLRARDRSGQTKYLPAIVPVPAGGFRLRWDPRTCTPRTGLAVEDIEERSPTVRIEWAVNRLLVVDNFRVLHRRPAVQGQGKRVLVRTYAWDE
jgi:alpha-ketoglutarate-dependent taurine dioxygenase